MAQDVKDLAAVMPFSEISSYFTKPVVRKELSKAELSEIVNLCRAEMFFLAINSLHRHGDVR